MSLMNNRLALAFVFATVSLRFTNALFAQTTYTETGDAGDLPATAQVVSGTAGEMLTAISGHTNLTNEISDSDMYEIYINSPSTFSASTTNFVAGANNFDTQLALFTFSGTGVVANDDAASGGEQSTIPAGSVTLAAGDYYLLLSGSGRYPVDSTGALIFPNDTDGKTAADATLTPSSTLPIAAYTGSSNEAGKYVIDLTGAQFVPSTVPEPETGACILAGAAGLILCTRIRRSFTRV